MVKPDGIRADEVGSNLAEPVAKRKSLYGFIDFP